MARKRGRPSFGSNRLSRVVQSATPDDTSDPVLRDLEWPFGLVAELDAGAKLQVLSSMVAEQLRKAGSDAMARFIPDGDETIDLAWARPWSSSTSTEAVLRTTEAQHFANERVVSALTAHLVQHLVVREDLRSVMQSARRRADDEADGLPEFALAFTQRLVDEGLTTRDVKHISKRRISDVLALIRAGVGTSSESSFDLSNMGSGTMTEDVGDVDPDATDHSMDHETEANRANAELVLDLAGLENTSNSSIESTRPETGSMRGGNGLVTSMEEDGRAGYGKLVLPPSNLGHLEETHPTESHAGGSDHPSEEGDQGSDAVQLRSAPAGMWDALDLGNLRYQIVERTASGQQDVDALRYKLPDYATPQDFPALSGGLAVLADRAVTEPDGTYGLSFVNRWSKRNGVSLTKEEMRIWSFLLVDYQHRSKNDTLTPPGWYHGVILPGPAGTSLVRQLVSLDVTDEIRANFYREV